MTKLNCTVKNCYYNKESMCCRDGIKVGGTDATVTDATYCGDFREAGDNFSSKCDCGPEGSVDVRCDAVRLSLIHISEPTRH